MAREDTLERIRRALPAHAQALAAGRDGTPVLELERGQVHAALAALRDAGFETGTFVTAIDRFPAEPRFEVYWQLLSIAHVERVRVKTALAEADAWVPTCTDLWPGASFHERECWDMFGIRFEGHPDLRRLLMPEAYDHFPLRKDFPHRGIEPDRLYREWDRERRRNWEGQG